MIASGSIVSRSPGETRLIGKTLAVHLANGTILGLRGELGSGKTTLIQGICQGMGVTEKVVSPTFVLMHVYQGRIPVYHFDLYRLEEKDFPDLGWEDYLQGSGISLLEWIDRAERKFPFDYLEVSLDYGETPDTRIIGFSPRGKPVPWLERFLNESSGA